MCNSCTLLSFPGMSARQEGAEDSLIPHHKARSLSLDNGKRLWKPAENSGAPMIGNAQSRNNAVQISDSEGKCRGIWQREPLEK